MTYERATVARPPDSNLGPLRARKPEAIAEMRRLAGGGASMRSIAEQFGVSVRTVYRYLVPGTKYFEVQIEGWLATFARSPGKAPWRVSRWEPPA